MISGNLRQMKDFLASKSRDVLPGGVLELAITCMIDKLVQTHDIQERRSRRSSGQNDYRGGFDSATVNESALLAIFC